MLSLGNKIIAGSFKAGASWEVGDVGISAFGIDEALNKRRYLNGQVISQAQFVEFTAMLKSRVSVYPSLATTEVNWQAEVTNSDLGQCGKFVIDDDAGTIRLPKVINIQGLIDLTNLGTTTEAGLPNIEGRFGQICYWNQNNMSGAFKQGVVGGNNGAPQSTAGSNGSVDIDASLSNPIYGNSATVQPESVRYPYFIQVAEGVETSVDVSREIELNNPFSLLDYKYSEYELDNASWLLSNGQFNSGATYPAVYDLLLQELNGTSSKLPYRSYVNTVGSLVNTDGVLSGFSASNYAELPKIFDTGNDTWELIFKVKTGASLSSNENIIGDGVGAPYNGLYIIIYNGKWGLGISSNGSSWDIADASRNIGQVSVVANTDYYLKASWDGSQYKLDVSTDGLTYQNSVTVNSTVKKVAKLQSIGCSAVNAGYQFNGTIDLNESYININGERWWTGRRKIITSAGDYADTDFVLNTTDTTFRLPLKVALASGNKIAGNGYSLGFTDGTVDGIVGLGLGYTSATGQIFVPFKINPVGTQNQYDASMTASSCIGITTDETKSGIETSANGLYLYFYVGEVVQDANIIAAAGVLNDMTNIKNGVGYSQLGTSFLSGQAMPSDRYIDLTLGASGATYTAPANGWFTIKSLNGNVAMSSFYNGNEVINSWVALNGSGIYLPVKKGASVQIFYTGSNIAFAHFVYAEGEE